MAGIKKTGVILQPRDHQLFLALSQVPLLDREVAKLVAGFHSTTRANTRLLQLTRAGLLQRFFIGTAAAGRKAVYRLSDKGAALAGCERNRAKRNHDENLVGDLFVQHELALAELYAIVRYQLAPGTRGRRWLTFHQPIAASGLMPDGYVELETPSGIRGLFLEVDRGTEPLRVWEKKIAGYIQLASSGDFASTFQQSQFRVLVVTEGDRRLRNLCLLIAKTTDKVFWLTTFKSIHGEGFWSSVWFRPTGDLRHPLL